MLPVAQKATAQKLLRRHFHAAVRVQHLVDLPARWTSTLYTALTRRDFWVSAWRLLIIPSPTVFFMRCWQYWMTSLPIVGLSAVPVALPQSFWPSYEDISATMFSFHQSTIRVVSVQTLACTYHFQLLQHGIHSDYLGGRINQRSTVEAIYFLESLGWEFGSACWT